MIKSCRNIRVLFFSAAMLLVFCVHSGKVYATGDGTEGTNSEGNTSLALSVGSLVRITGVGDVNLTYHGSESTTLSDTVCIYTNNSSGHYVVTAAGSGTSSAFTVSSGSHIIPYSVKWNNAPSSGGVTLTVNQPSTTQTGANTSSETCIDTGMNANFDVVFAPNDLMSVPADTYTGTLTLMVEPTT